MTTPCGRRNSLNKMRTGQFRPWQLMPILVSVMAVFLWSFARSGETLSSEMSRFHPFIGKWNTVSIFPESGLRVVGELEYRWVLGKNWVMVEFVGKHPEREYWEAYALIRHDSRGKHYVSYDFFNEKDPVQMIGKWISPRTLRFEISDKKSRSGIDYTIQDNGTVYQENWIEDPGKGKKITLRTYYSRK